MEGFEFRRVAKKVGGGAEVEIGVTDRGGRVVRGRWIRRRRRMNNGGRHLLPL